MLSCLLFIYILLLTQLQMADPVRFIHDVWPHGDVCFVVRLVQSQHFLFEEHAFICSSELLIQASRYFKALLSGGFREARALRKAA